MIRRAESYRSWADIEDLADGYESLTTSFEQHKQTAASAFEEPYNHIEKFKRAINRKQEDQSNQFKMMREEFTKFRGETRAIEEKKSAVTMDDIVLLKKNLFEIRDA